MQVIKWETEGSVFHYFQFLHLLFCPLNRGNWIQQNPFKNSLVSNLPVSRIKKWWSNLSCVLELSFASLSLWKLWLSAVSHRYCTSNYIRAMEQRIGYRPYTNDLLSTCAVYMPAVMKTCLGLQHVALGTAVLFALQAIPKLATGFYWVQLPLDQAQNVRKNLHA